MNITDITRTIAIIPDVVREAVQFSAWNYGRLMAELSGENELDDDDEGEGNPLPLHEAGRIALEFVMVGRMNKDRPKEFQAMMEGVIPEVDSPQHAIDVIMSLSGMVNVLAEDEDLARFGQFILAHESGGHH